MAYIPGQDGPPPGAPDPNPPATQPTAGWVQQWYQNFFGRPPSPEELSAALAPGFDFAALANSPESLDYLKAQNPAPPSAPPPPTSAPPPGSLGTFVPPPQLGMPTLPQFVAPTFTPPPAFADPTMGDVENDPGYAFARDEGQKALERSRAAQGTLNSGGTLKDLIAWGGNFATQRYADVRNRKKDTYMANYQTQYIDPYHLAYTSALDTFNPKLKGYETEAAWNQHANDMDWQHAFDLWNSQYNHAYQYFTS